MIKRKLVSASFTSLVSSILFGAIVSSYNLKHNMVHESFLSYLIGNILSFGIFIYLVVFTYGFLSSVTSELITNKFTRNQILFRGIAHAIFGILGIFVLMISFNNYDVHTLKEAITMTKPPVPWYVPIFISLIFFGIDEWSKNNPLFYKCSKWSVGISTMMLLYLVIEHWIGF